MDRTGIAALLRLNKPRAARCSLAISTCSLRISRRDSHVFGHCVANDLVIAIADRHISRSRDYVSSRDLIADASTRSPCSPAFVHIAVVCDVTPRCPLKFRAHLGETGRWPIRETRLIGIPSRAVRPAFRARNVLAATRPPSVFQPSHREGIGVVHVTRLYSRPFCPGPENYVPSRGNPVMIHTRVISFISSLAKAEKTLDKYFAILKRGYCSECSSSTKRCVMFLRRNLLRRRYKSL